MCARYGSAGCRKERYDGTMKGTIEQSKAEQVGASKAGQDIVA